MKDRTLGRASSFAALASLVAVTGCSEPIRGSDTGPGAPDAPAVVDAPPGVDAPAPPDAPMALDTPATLEDAPTPTDVPTGSDTPGDAGPPEVTTGAGPALFACTATHPTTGANVDATIHVARLVSGGDVASAAVDVFPEEATVPTACDGPSMCLPVTTDASGRAFPLAVPAEAVRTVRVHATAGTLETFTNHSIAPAVDSVVWEISVFPTSAAGLAYGAVGRTRAPATAILSGRVSDCAGTPVGESIVRIFRASGVEVLAGTAATDPFVGYLNSGLPSSSQTRTTTDGEWFAGNIPVLAGGERMRVESWGVVGGTYRRLGCETVLVTPDGLGAVEVGPMRSDYSTGNPCRL